MAGLPGQPDIGNLTAIDVVHLVLENPMPIVNSTGLIAGHYECRSLAETLPVFTDLLAMEIAEQRPAEATLKHPNTDWRLIVHEGGPSAPEKTFDNHYGFRVASHQEVEAAWQFIEAHKEQYKLSKITRPQSAHFAYSIYFREPGGNHLEIEYYNPGGAQHGRSHTAGHWDKPLEDPRFAARGYVPQAFTHGTLQCDDIERSRQFYTEVLGLEIAAGFNNDSPSSVTNCNSNGKASFIFSDPDRNWWELISP